MKVKNYILTLILLLLSLWTIAQNQIDTTDDFTVLVFGRQFRVHTLKQGENLLAISKVYKVPLDQIFAYNIFNDSILKPGITIKIPQGDYPKLSILDTVVCCLHKVRRKESLVSIAQKYNISPELLLKFNPQIKNRKLRRHKYLRIPAIKYPKDYQDQFFIYHVYRRGETPQLLAAYYSIPVQDILEFNSDSAFSLGKIIAIPKKHYDPEQVSILRADYITLPDFTGLDQIYGQPPENPPCETYKHTPQTQYNIALIMPFFINENHLTLQDLKHNKKLQLYANSKYFFQFLMGMLMAMDELRQLGININLHIYDSRNSRQRIQNILNRDEFQQMDLVIGPVYSEHYDLVREYAQIYDLSFVAPLTRKTSVIDSNPNVFLANPSDQKLVKRIAQYITPVAHSSNIIVLYNDQYSQNLAQKFEQQLRQFLVEQFGYDSCSLQNTFFDPTHPQRYNYLFDRHKQNLVIVPVNDEVFVNGLLNYLNALQMKRYKITVFGMPSWDHFRNFDLNWFLTLKIHYPSAYYLDPKDPKVKDFQQKYLKIFHALPTYYSYLGYDITNYFVHALKQYGKTFRFCLTPYSIEPANKGIYMNFEFEKDTFYNGFENNAVFMLYYDRQMHLHKTEKFEPLQ